MRIDAYNQVSQVYQANKVNKTAKAYAASGIGMTDQLEISQTGRDYQVAKQAVAGASDIREDKVAQLKQAVDSGSYCVDTGDFASKLLEKYNQQF